MLISNYLNYNSLSILNNVFFTLSEETPFVAKGKDYELESVESVLSCIKKNRGTITGAASSKRYIFQFDKSLSQLELHIGIIDLIYYIEIHLCSRKFKKVKPMISNWGRVLLGESKLLVLEFNISLKIDNTVFWHGRYIPNNIIRTRNVESDLVGVLKNNESFTLISLLKTNERSSIRRKKVAYACQKYVINRVFIFYSSINMDKLMTYSKKYFKKVAEYSSYIINKKKLQSLPESIYINLLKEDIEYLLSKIPESRFSSLIAVDKCKKGKEVKVANDKETNSLVSNQLNISSSNDDMIILPFTYIDWHIKLDANKLKAGSPPTYDESNYIETYPKGKERIFDLCSRRNKYDKVNYTEDTVNEEKSSIFDLYTYVLRYNYQYGMSSDQVRIFFHIRQMVRYGLKLMSLHDSSSKKYIEADLIVKENIQKFHATLKIVQLQRDQITLKELKRYSLLRENALTSFNFDFWKARNVNPPYLYILKLCTLNEYRKKMSLEELRLSGLIACDECDIIYFYFVELMSRLCYQYPEIVLDNSKRTNQVGLYGLTLPEHEVLLCGLVHRADCLPPRSTTYKQNFGMWEMMVRKKYNNSYLPGVTFVCIRSGVYF